MFSIIVGIFIYPKNNNKNTHTKWISFRKRIQYVYVRGLRCARLRRELYSWYEIYKKDKSINAHKRYVELELIDFTKV